MTDVTETIRYGISDSILTTIDYSNIQRISYGDTFLQPNVTVSNTQPCAEVDTSHLAYINSHGVPFQSVELLQPRLGIYESSNSFDEFERAVFTKHSLGEGIIIYQSTNGDSWKLLLRRLGVLSHYYNCLFLTSQFTVD